MFSFIFVVKCRGGDSGHWFAMTTISREVATTAG